MREPSSLVLRSIALAAALVVASVGTSLAHAGETHAETSPGGWAAVGWYGVAAVVAVIVMLGLLTRHRPVAPAAVPDDEVPSGPRLPGQ